MDEREWLVCADPGQMLDHHGWMSGPWPNPATDTGMRRRWVMACRDAYDAGRAEPINWVSLSRKPDLLGGCIESWSSATAGLENLSMQSRADLLRCVVGNPWRHYTLCGEQTETFPGDRCTGCDPILQWHDGTIPALAREIRDSGDVERLLVLADALEEAGCPGMVKCWDCNDESGYRLYCQTCADSGYCGKLPNPILAHLRLPGPHCRGCHVLTLILGGD